jgi:hypothetical protein
MKGWLRIRRKVGGHRHHRVRHRLKIGCSKPWERLGCGGVARCREHGIRHVE